MGMDEMVEEIRLVRQATDCPFGVDLLTAAPGDLPAQVNALIDGGASVFVAGLGIPAEVIALCHDRGVLVVNMCGKVRHAVDAVAAGCDIVVAQGTEAGGHTGRIGTLALLPQVMDAVSPTPVIAAGGIASGRALAGVLATGAAAAWCGTAFLVSEEANQPDVQKQRILDAAAEDTRVTRVYSGKTMRNINNPLIEAWEREGMSALPMGMQNLLIRDLEHSIHKAGRTELLMNAAGQTSGMLTKKRPAGEILDEMVAEAAEILASGLSSRVHASL